MASRFLDQNGLAFLIQQLDTRYASQSGVYVDLKSAQTIAGVKTFTSPMNIGSTTQSNSNQSIIYGKLVVNPTYDTNNTYNEGIRINCASNGWAEINFGGANGTSGGVGGWLVGRRGAAGSYGGVSGDFTIEYGGSAGVGLTLPYAGGRPSWYDKSASVKHELAYTDDIPKIEIVDLR